MNTDDDTFDKVERRLRNLPLQQPSAAFQEKMLKRVRGHRIGVRALVLAIGGTLSAAAILLLAFIPRGEELTPPIAEAPAHIEPEPTIRLTTESQQWVDDGIVGQTPQGRVRQFRLLTYQGTLDGDKQSFLVAEMAIQVPSMAY